MENEKVKICALTTISKTMDWFVVDNMRNLSENGYDVTLICDMDDGFVQRNSDFAKCINVKMQRGISVKDLFTKPFKLYKLFKANHFDVIYYMSPNASLYASVAGFFARTKRRIYAQTGIRYVSLSGVKRQIFKFIEKITCKFSTNVRAVSYKNMEFAIDEKLTSSQKIKVVGKGGTVGVSLAECDSFNHIEARNELRQKYNIPCDAFVFGYVGRINKDKGIEELIQAFEIVCNQNADCYLLLVGMIDQTNSVSEELLERAKNNPRVVFTGNVEPTEVYKHMAMFDTLTHPTYREGFGKVLQEAMGMMIPIITTDVPGPSEVIENGISGVLVKAQNVEELKQEMLNFYSSKELRDKYAKAGRDRAEQFFDRPIMLNNLLQDMNEVVKS